jgi:NAD(P)-dependent dehydrogenase (short-subunit alcohol dehydrogenase family)
MNSQVVLITGGLSSIGRAAAVAFAKEGAKVVVGGRRDDAGKEVVAELRSFGSKAFKRAGTVEEIADAIAFLASNKAAFITGQIIDVNGGITAS